MVARVTFSHKTMYSYNNENLEESAKEMMSKITVPDNLKEHFESCPVNFDGCDEKDIRKAFAIGLFGVINCEKVCLMLVKHLKYILGEEKAIEMMTESKGYFKDMESVHDIMTEIESLGPELAQIPIGYMAMAETMQNES